MPRHSPSAQESERIRIARRIRHHVNDALQERGLCIEEAAKSLGMKQGTLYNRFKNPGSFTLLELQGIANAMNISLASLVDGKEAPYE
jgi:AraC-like DNA-binding protein